MSRRTRIQKRPIPPVLENATVIQWPSFQDVDIINDERDYVHIVDRALTDAEPDQQEPDGQPEGQPGGQPDGQPD